MSAKEILKKEYPTIYKAYKDIAEEQFELFAKKHLDYGMGNVSAGTQLVNNEMQEFTLGDSLPETQICLKPESAFVDKDN